MESIVVSTDQTHDVAFAHERSVDANRIRKTSTENLFRRIERRRTIGRFLDQKLLSPCRPRNEGVRRREVPRMETTNGTDSSDASETKRSERIAAERK